MENFLILFSFVIVCFLYFKYVHKKLMQNLENKIINIKKNIDDSDNLIKNYQDKITILETELQKAEENFKIASIEIDNEIEKIKNKKILILEEEFIKKQKQIESDAALKLEMHQIEIKNKIIETAYLLAIEYFKNKTEYSDENKKKIIEKLLRNIKFE